MTLTIGKLAKSAGVNVETVRYYQRIGLLNVPDIPLAGFRRYPATDVARVRFIKRAQRLGFTLKEIADLLLLREGHCDDVRTLAEQKRARIDAQIKDLGAMCQVLDRLIDRCIEEHGPENCSLIDALSESSDRRS